CWAHHFGLPLVPAAAHGGPACVQGDAVGDTVEPAGQGVFLYQRSRMPRQKYEGRLKSVFGVLEVAEDPPAHGEDQRSVSLREHGKRVLIIPGTEGAEQLGIDSFLAALTGGQAPNMLHQPVQRSVGHGLKVSRTGGTLS